MDIVTTTPLNAHADWEALRSAVTGNDRFFCRNHFPIPERVPPLEWNGKVLSLEELQSMPQVERLVTMECAGNGRTLFSPLPSGTPWGIRAVSTASFTGVPLIHLLERFPGDWKHLIFRGGDGDYERSLSTEEVQQTDPFLALKMNGEDLPLLHGGPVRLVVPGYYAMTSIKWLTSVRYSEEPSTNYYQVDDYIWQPDGQPMRPVTWMRAKSILVDPEQGATLSGPVKVRGWAWGGRSPVAGVILDWGHGPHQAELGEELGERAWRSFEASLELEPGDYVLRAFCRLLDGEEQPVHAIWNKQGYENNSAPEVRFKVS